MDFNLLYFLSSHVGGEVPVGVFERVTVVVAVNENVPDGVVGLFVQTLKCYFHCRSVYWVVYVIRKNDFCHFF